MLKNKVMIGLQILQYMRKKADADERVMALDLVVDLSISESYVEQILRTLREAGLIYGKRGPGGGQMLAEGGDE